MSYKHAVSFAIVRNSILFILFLSWSNFVIAKPLIKEGNIKGQVIDQLSKATIEFANIVLYSATDNQMLTASVTKSDGTFSINAKNKGSYFLQISFIGFEKKHTKKFSLSKTNDQVDLGIIELVADNQEILNVDVIGQKRAMQLKLDKQVIDPSTIASAAGGSAIDVLERTPSVSVDVEGNVKLRGSGSFQVLIDGRPTLLNSQMALEQMPVSQIENIEIITNPSARYNAEGDAGIINIRTKKNLQKGITGLLHLNGSTVNSYGINLLVGFQQEKIFWRIGGGQYGTNRVGDFYQLKETTVTDTLYHAESEGERIGINYNTSAKVGLTLKGEQGSYDFDLEGGHRGFGYDGNLLFNETRSVKGTLFSENAYTSHDMKDLWEDFVTGSFAFNRWFDQKEHNLTGSLFGTYGKSLEYFENDLMDGIHQVDGQKSWEEEFRVTIQAKIDYERPINHDDGVFEAGYELFYYVEDGDYGMKDFLPTTNEFIWQEQYYSIYRFERPIQSVYTILNNKSKNLSYQIGLRGEYTHRVLDTSTEGFTHNQNRFELFPSAHLGYTLKEEQQIKGSYSRRTVRPRLHFLEPYVTFADSYTARTGNPYVRPEYVNSFELGYQKYIGKENNLVSLSLFHRLKKDKIERIRTIYAPNVTLDSISNVGNDFSTGVELMGNFSLFKWWSLDASANLFHYRIDSDYKLPGIDEQSMNWEARFSNYFKFKTGTRLQFDGNYVGPSVSTQGTRKAFFYTNLSAKHQFFNKSLTATLAARDVFSTARFENSQVGDGLYSLTKVNPRSPLIMLSLAYRINDIKNLKREGAKSDDLFEGAGY